MAFTVLYDTCALYPNTQRNLLIRLARTGMVRARRSTAVLDELDRALEEHAIPASKRERLLELMNAAVPDCLVEGFEPLIGDLKLPDPNDRHVLAAAIKVGAQLIVTNNLADFPSEILASWSIEAKTPDDFILDLIDFDARVVYACVQLSTSDEIRRNPSRRYSGSLSDRALSDQSRSFVSAELDDSDRRHPARPDSRRERRPAPQRRAARPDARSRAARPIRGAAPRAAERREGGWEHSSGERRASRRRKRSVNASGRPSASEAEARASGDR